MEQSTDIKIITDNMSPKQAAGVPTVDRAASSSGATAAQAGMVLPCFGDSLVAGYPFSQEASWLAEAARVTGFTLVNYGVEGECVQEVLARMRRWQPEVKPGQVLFLAGVNDILQGVPQSFTMADLQSMRNWCWENKYRLGLMLPWLSEDGTLNKKITSLREMMLEEFGTKVTGDLRLLDVQPALVQAAARPGGQPLFVDGLHPTQAVYKSIGSYVAPLLKAWALEQNSSL